MAKLEEMLTKSIGELSQRISDHVSRSINRRDRYEHRGDRHDVMSTTTVIGKQLIDHMVIEMVASLVWRWCSLIGTEAIQLNGYHKWKISSASIVHRMQRSQGDLYQWPLSIFMEKLYSGMIGLNLNHVMMCLHKRNLLKALCSLALRVWECRWGICKNSAKNNSFGVSRSLWVPFQSS